MTKKTTTMTTKKQKSKITFETLPDGTNVITTRGKNKWGHDSLQQEIIKNNAVFKDLKEIINDTENN